MTDTVQDERLRTRRSLLTAAAGGAAALAVGAIKPGAVAAGVAEPMLLETNNLTTIETGITNSTSGSTALYANGLDAGIGIDGASDTGIGVRGHSQDVSDPATNVTNAGVVGVAGDEGAIASNIALTGVYGYSDPSPSPDFVAAGVWGDSADWGVIGSGSGGVLGDGVIGVLGSTAVAGGAGVLAVTDEASALALLVEGRAMFSRSGRATVNAGSRKKVVNLAGCTASTLVVAVLAQNRAGRYVRAAVPEAGKFTIYLNNDVGKNTKVTWIAFSNPATGTG